jgi:choline dehydrogenase-like flavoprotein
MARAAQLETFDYIIVGAGSAGCVLANRLTASGRHRVLLLEAGGKDSNIWIHIPLGYGKLFANPKVNWLYASEPEPELNNRKIIQITGGNSAIPAGALRMCCPISARQRIRSAAPTRCTAWAGRSRSPM